MCVEADFCQILSHIVLWLQCNINLFKLFTDQLSISVVSNNSIIAKGRTAHLTVMASGIGTLRYQWKRRNIDNLPDKILGEDTAVLIIPKLDISDGGEYYCIVSNMWNRSMESDNIILTVYGMLLYR